MSSNEIKVLLNPILDVNQNKSELLRKGPTTNSYYVYNAENSSDSSIAFLNIEPPKGTIVKRELAVEYEIASVIAVGATNANKAQVQSGEIFPLPVRQKLNGEIVNGTNTNNIVSVSLASYPLQTNCSSIDVVLNGQKIDVETKNLPLLYPLLANDCYKKKYGATFPTQPDNNLIYNSTYPTNGYINDVSFTGITPEIIDSYSPLNPHDFNSNIQTRSSIIAQEIQPITKLNDDSQGNAWYYTVLKWKVREIIELPVFANNECSSMIDGFCTMDKLNLRFNLKENLNSMITYALENNFTVPYTLNFVNLFTTISGNKNYNIILPSGVSMDAPNSFYIPQLAIPKLILDYLSPPKFLMPLPKKQIFDYYNMAAYEKPNSIDATTSGNFTVSLDVNLPYIPSRLFIFAKINKDNLIQQIKNYYFITQNDLIISSLGNAFLPITNISIDMQNRQKLLSTASEFDLYNISVKNGYQLDYYSWKKTNGLAILDFNADICIPENVQTSSYNNFSVMRINATFNTGFISGNFAGLYPKFDYVVLAEMNGKIIMDETSAQTEIQNYSKYDFLEAQYMDKNYIKKQNTLSTAGGLIDRLSNIISNIF